MKNNTRWKHFTYPLLNSLVFGDKIYKALANFWYNCIKGKSNFNIQFKVKFVTGERRSISYLQTVTNKDLDLLCEIFTEFWNIKSDYYHQSKIDEIIFIYQFINIDTDNYVRNLNKH